MSLADVTSANVVGYANAQIRNGSKMISVSFDQISLKDGGMKLSQLAPVGYEDVEYFKQNSQQGIKSDRFTISVLSSSGSVAKYADGPFAGRAKKWCFRRSCPKTAFIWENDGHWVMQDDGETPIVADTETDYMFERGDALWFTVDSLCYDNNKGVVAADKYKLTNNGQAILDSNAVVLRSGSKGVSIPLSASITLNQIRIIGYEDVPYFKQNSQQGIKPDRFTISVRSNTGSVEKYEDGPFKGRQKKWCFVRSCPKSDFIWDGPGYWVMQDDGETVVDSTNDYTFNLGDALWVSVDGVCYDNNKGIVAPDKYLIEFPGIDDKYASDTVQE